MRYFLLIPVLILTACTVSNEQISTIREQCVADFGGKRLAPVEKCVYDRAIKEIDAVQNTNGYPYKAQFQQLMAERIQIATAYDKKKISKTDYETANLMAEAKFNDTKAAIDQHNTDNLLNYFSQRAAASQYRTDLQNQQLQQWHQQRRFINTDCTSRGNNISCTTY